jgi:hypothetical protein
MTDRKQQSKNNDKQLWRKVPDDYYSPSISVTEQGNISLHVGGICITHPVEHWFKLASQQIDALYKVDGLREKIAKITEKWNTNYLSGREGCADEIITLLQQDTKDTCPECNGCGKANPNDFDQNYEPCERCGGSGIKPMPLNYSSDLKCPTCKGTGKVEEV